MQNHKLLYCTINKSFIWPPCQPNQFLSLQQEYHLPVYVDWLLSCERELLIHIIPSLLWPDQPIDLHIYGSITFRWIILQSRLFGINVVWRQRKLLQEKSNVAALTLTYVKSRNSSTARTIKMTVSGIGQPTQIIVPFQYKKGNFTNIIRKRNKIKYIRVLLYSYFRQNI